LFAPVIQAAFPQPVFVKLILGFPCFAHSAKLLLDPIDDPMAVFKSEVSSDSFPLWLVRLIRSCVCTAHATSRQFIFLSTVFVICTFLFPPSALGATLLRDSIDYPMALLISQVPSHTFALAMETLAGVLLITICAA